MQSHTPRRRFHKPCGRILVFLVLLGIPCGPLHAASGVTMTSETIFRYFERDVAGVADQKVVPAYEYFQLETGNLSNNELSLHLYGWGRYDLADSGYYDDKTAGALLYGYLEYQPANTGFKAKIGRQTIFEGIANESVDGIWLGSDLGSQFSVSLYGGRPVGLDTGITPQGDSIWGGRISHHRMLAYDLGASFKQIRNETGSKDSLGGLDFSLFLPADILLAGLSSYNFETEGLGEYLVEARFKLLALDFRPYVQMVQYEDFFSSETKNVNLFNGLAAVGEELRIVGGEVNWHQSPRFDLGCRIKSIDYDLRADSAMYYSALLKGHPTGRLELGGEAGYMDGTSAENTYLLGRVYGYLNKVSLLGKRGFLSCDVIYVNFDQAIFGKSNSYSGSIGAGARFFKDTLEIKLSGDYTSGPYFDKDFRLLLAVRFLSGAR